jgi:hypothetical protein
MALADALAASDCPWVRTRERRRRSRYRYRWALGRPPGSVRTRLRPRRRSMRDRRRRLSSAVRAQSWRMSPDRPDRAHSVSDDCGGPFGLGGRGPSATSNPTGLVIPHRRLRGPSRCLGAGLRRPLDCGERNDARGGVPILSGARGTPPDRRRVDGSGAFSRGSPTSVSLGRHRRRVPARGLGPRARSVRDGSHGARHGGRARRRRHPSGGARSRGQRRRVGGERSDAPGDCCRQRRQLENDTGQRHARLGSTRARSPSP